MIIPKDGDAREYAYKVVKSEIESDGDVELTTTEEVASFAATKTPVVKGNLIIGSDAEEAEKITDISALASLKEVTGNIVIRNSYNGADLTGLDNIVSAGGLQVGSTDVASKATELHMISMKALETLSGPCRKAPARSGNRRCRNPSRVPSFPLSSGGSHRPRTRRSR